MPRAFFPDIAKTDYEAVRLILYGDLPDTYDEWRNFQTREATNLLGKGYEIVWIEVNPDELARYCETMRRNRNRHVLDNFCFATGFRTGRATAEDARSPPVNDWSRYSPDRIR